MALYAFDGTNQLRTGPEGVEQVATTETNVSRFLEAYRAAHSHPNTWYTVGLGRSWHLLPRPLSTLCKWTLVVPLMMWCTGVFFGAGAKWRLRRAYRQLCTNYHERGDTEIVIVGFSRGAALALAFANVIRHLGVRRPDERPWVGLWRHRHLGWTWRHHRARGNETARIKFIGLWDTVGSFGIPVGFFGIDFQQINLGLDLTLPDSVGVCCHAMALDETRRTFRPTRVEGAEEVWFRGVHANIGGGFEKRGLSDIALAWMLERARESDVELDDDGTEPLLTDLTRVELFAIGRNRQLPGAWREVKPGDSVHWTVFERQPLASDEGPAKTRLNTIR